MNPGIQKSVTDTFSNFNDTLAAFTEQEINTIPFSGSWTAGQVGEHITKSIAGFNKLLDGNTAQTGREPDEKVALVEKIFLDFTTKMKSPDFILPSSDEHKKDELIAVLDKYKQAMAGYAATHDLSPTCLDFELPGSGKFTRLEWISFYIAHTKRHTHQLQNIYEIITTGK